MPYWIRSASLMSFFWAGCAVMPLVYLYGLWDGRSSPAFIVGQVVLGVVGLCREAYIQNKYRRVE